MTPKTDVTVAIVLNEKGTPPGTLADADRHVRTGRRDGLTLMGFAVWERRGTTGDTVTFSAGPYRVNGARRRFARRRPLVDTSAPTGVRDFIVQTYGEAEATTL